MILTIYDTWGILTSGFVDSETALRVLMIGRAYTQIVIKTDKAAAALSFTSSVILSHEEIAKYRKSVEREEKAFQEQFATILYEMPD